jgi:hypothetical protein
MLSKRSAVVVTCEHLARSADENLAQTVEIMTTAIREMQADGSVKFDMPLAANQTQRFETRAAAKQTC